MLISGGGFLLLFCLWMASGNVRIIYIYEHAIADVVKSERIGPPVVKGLNNYSVQVRYTAPSGRTQVASVDAATTNYEIGEVIDVYYLPDSGYEVIAGDFMQMWFHVLGVGIAAIALLFFGLKPSPKKQLPPTHSE
jgi:hypothetical protein